MSGKRAARPIKLVDELTQTYSRGRQGYTYAYGHNSLAKELGGGNRWRSCLVVVREVARRIDPKSYSSHPPKFWAQLSLGQAHRVCEGFPRILFAGHASMALRGV